MLRIISLLNLGYSVSAIQGKVTLSHPKATNHTISTFIKNYNEGNIEIPDDAPAPTHMVDELTDSSRIDALEERVRKLELIQKETVMDKVRGWIRS